MTLAFDILFILPGLATFIELPCVFVVAIKNKKDGVGLFGIATVILIISLVVSGNTSVQLALLGPGAFLFVMSIHLARTFAKTNRVLEDKNAEIEQELQDANQMQMSLLPKSSPEIEGYQIAGSSIAAKEVGGDFFDNLIPEDNQQISIAVGDVSGKGLRGAINAVMASGILRIYAGQDNDTSSVMSSINKALCQSMEQDMNVTMVIAQFDNTKKQMTLANAGGSQGSLIG